MKQTRFGLLVVMIFIFSCNSDSSPSPAKNENRISTNEVSFSGTFSGTTPCADCPGIQTTVSFKDDSTFIEQLEYLGRNTAFSDTGRWSISDSIITVSFASSNSVPRFFRIKSDTSIAQLDGDKKEIEGALADKFVLKKNQ